jgi:hypothetical protein
MDTLTHFKDPKYIPLEEALEQVKKYQPPAEHQDTTQQADQEFRIQEFDEFYRIFGATCYGNKDLVFDWKKDLLYGGKVHNIDEWLGQKAYQGWMVPSATIYTTTVLALYKNRTNLGLRKSTLLKMNDVQNMLMSDFANGLMMTRTSVTYVPRALRGMDFIDDNLNFEKESRANLFGIDRALMPEDSEITEQLLGSGDAGTIVEAYKMLCGTYNQTRQAVPYLRCSPTDITLPGIKCAVAIGVETKFPSRFLISADKPYSAKLRARGVRAILRKDIEDGFRK